VPTACNVGRSSSRVRRRACGLPYPASGRRLRPSVALHICISTRVPRRRRPSRCPPFHAPVPPATSTDCPATSDGRGAVIPWPVVRGPMAVALPQSRSPIPFPPAVLGAPPPAMLIVRSGDGVPSSARNGAGFGL